MGLKKDAPVGSAQFKYYKYAITYIVLWYGYMPFIMQRSTAGSAYS